MGIPSNSYEIESARNGQVALLKVKLKNLEYEWGVRILETYLPCKSEPAALDIYHKIVEGAR